MGNRSFARRVWAPLLEMAQTETAPAALRELFVQRPDAVVEITVAQGLSALFADQVRSWDLELPTELRQADEAARFARATSHDLLGRIDAVFAAENIPWVALKGVVLASFFRRPELRTFLDVDVLVAGQDLGRVIDALESIGITDLNENWGNYERYGVAETPLWGPGVAIDLHWHLISLGRLRDGTSFDITEMLARSRRVQSGGVGVPSLDAEDLLLHVALHAGLGGANRLSVLRDVDQLVRNDERDWDVFVARAHQAGVAPTVGQVLDRCRVLFGSHVSDAVVDSLCPLSLLRVRRMIDRVGRGSQLPDYFARGIPVTVSGDSWPNTLSRLRREATWRRNSSNERWSVGDPDGLLYWGSPSGGADGRDRYLELASRG